MNYKSLHAGRGAHFTSLTTWAWIMWVCIGCDSHKNPHPPPPPPLWLPPWNANTAATHTATLALSGRLSGSAGALTANGEASVRLAVGEGGCVQWETFDAKAQTHPLGGSHAFTLSDIDPQTASAAYKLAWAALQAHVLTKLGGPWQALETKHIPLAPSLPPGAHVEPLRAKLLGNFKDAAVFQLQTEGQADTLWIAGQQLSQVSASATATLGVAASDLLPQWFTLDMSLHGQATYGGFQLSWWASVWVSGRWTWLRGSSDDPPRCTPP